HVFVALMLWPLYINLFPYTTLFRSVSENLFKLVDEKTDVLGGILLDHAHQFGESVLAAAQYGVRDRDVDGAFVGLQITFADHVIDRCFGEVKDRREDRKSTRLNSSHVKISYAVFCLKKK